MFTISSKCIKNSEKAQRSFNKISRQVKKEVGRSVRYLSVPSPSTNHTANSLDPDPQNWTKVFDKEQQFEILLRQNARHLQRSKHSIFAQGPLAEAGNSEIVVLSWRLRKGLEGAPTRNNYGACLNYIFL